MTNKKQMPVFWLFLTVILVGVVTLVWWPVPSQAGSDLPDRNTPTPTRPSHDDDDDDGSSSPVGAYIELHAQGPVAGVWSVVQWQDANGDWQTVEGWQGTLNNGTRRWWVAAKDFGKGPFRWAIFNAPGGSLIAAGDSFNLPSQPNQVVYVSVAAK